MTKEKKATEATVIAAQEEKKKVEVKTKDVSKDLRKNSLARRQMGSF